MITADNLRKKSFRFAWRGYEPTEVDGYMARMALVYDMLEDQPFDASPIEDRPKSAGMPVAYSPDAVRSAKFRRVVRGYSRALVTAYVQEIADDLEWRMQVIGMHVATEDETDSSLPAPRPIPTFDSELRGYSQLHVETFVASIHLIMDGLAASERVGQYALPSEFQPDEVRARTFPKIFNGYSRDQVAAYLHEQATEIERLQGRR